MPPRELDQGQRAAVARARAALKRYEAASEKRTAALEDHKLAVMDALQLGVSQNQLAAMLGVARSSFYRYFGKTK